MRGQLLSLVELVIRRAAVGDLGLEWRTGQPVSHCAQIDAEPQELLRSILCRRHLGGAVARSQLCTTRLVSRGSVRVQEGERSLPLVPL